MTTCQSPVFILFIILAVAIFAYLRGRIDGAARAAKECLKNFNAAMETKKYDQVS